MTNVEAGYDPSLSALATMAVSSSSTLPLLTLSFLGAPRYAVEFTKAMQQEDAKGYPRMISYVSTRLVCVFRVYLHRRGGGTTLSNSAHY